MPNQATSTNRLARHPTIADTTQSPHPKQTQTATQIISDYVEGALADVRAQFVEALRRRGGGASRASSEADAFYEEHVASVSVCMYIVIGLVAVGLLNE